MTARHEVLVKIVSQKGKCEQDHKVGEEWMLHGKTPEGICLGALPTILSAARALMFGASFPWESDPDATWVACPDPENPVVFEVRRLPNK